MDWQPPIKLWKHQEISIEKCLAKKHFALFHDLGVGKTMIIVCLYVLRCFQEKRVIPCLIMGPLSTVYGWEKTFKQVAPQKLLDHLQIIDGETWQKKKLQIDAPNKRIFITNIDIINSKAWAFLSKKKFDFFVADESQKLKDIRASRTKRCISFSDMIPEKYILTGTPTPKSYLDIWSQFRIMNHKLFSLNFKSFRAEYFLDKNEGMPLSRYYPDWQVRKDTFDKLQGIILDNSYRVLKSEVLELPEFVTKNVYVKMGKEQAEHYEEMKEQFITYIDDDAVSADMAMTQAMRLQQITCGVLSTESGVIKTIPSAKNAALKELLEDITPLSKVVVWSNFATTYPMIEEVCKQLKIDYVSYTGKQSQREKQESKNQFINNENIRVIIINQASGGTGTDGLQVANYAIYLSRNFNYGDDAQSQDRIYRGGSEIHDKVTRINIICEDTVDEDVHESLSLKDSNSSFLFKLREKYGRKSIGADVSGTASGCADSCDTR